MSYLEVTDLSKSYGTSEVLTGFSFEVGAGSIFALVGPDGAGKTTLMRTICNLLKPDRGEIRIDGRDATKQFEELKPLLGYMPQQFSLYPDLSVQENLSFYAGLHGITGRGYRERRDYLYRFSNLEPFAGRRAEALSGGMKQKLALSCALIHNPRLLVLDEPTTGVDPLSRRQFWEILAELRRQGVAILVSTPYMDEVARADRAGFIFGGSKLAEGHPGGLTQLFRGTVYHLDIVLTVALVREVDAIDHLDARRFGAGLHLYVDEGYELGDFGDRLRKVGVDPAKARKIEPDLEDCFIQLMKGADDSVRRGS